LLDTYSTERAPVAKQIVTRANQSGREFMQLIDALGITDDMSPEQMHTAIASRKDQTAEGATKREAVRKAMELKNYEFNAHDVEQWQHHRSSSVISDDTDKSEPIRDPELHYQATTYTSGRLSHC